jgi:hypothetical protein
MTPTKRLKSTGTGLVIDWPTKEVPETLARAGLRVVVRGGPGSEDYSLYQLRDGALCSIIETAKRLNAKEILDTVAMSAEGVRDAKGGCVSEPEEQFARNLVRSAGPSHRAQPYIAEVALES